jgi:hypothetical protein
MSGFYNFLKNISKLLKSSPKAYKKFKLTLAETNKILANFYTGF